MAVALQDEEAFFGRDRARAGEEQVKIDDDVNAFFREA
jgi:hypothetical protein